MTANKRLLSNIFLSYSVVIGLFLSSCGTTKPPYAGDVLLSQQRLMARDSAFTVGIPPGWFAAEGEALAQGLGSLFIRDDYSAAISIKEIQVDATAKQRIGKDGLPLLVSLRKSFHSGEATTSVQQYEAQGRQFASYEMTGEDGRKKRIVCLSVSGRYFESEASSVKGQWSNEQLGGMFRIQESIVASLQTRATSIP